MDYKKCSELYQNVLKFGNKFENLSTECQAILRSRTDMAGKTSPLARQSSTSTYDNDVNARRKKIPMLGQDTFDSPQVFFDPAKKRPLSTHELMYATQLQRSRSRRQGEEGSTNPIQPSANLRTTA